MNPPAAPTEGERSIAKHKNAIVALSVFRKTCLKPSGFDGEYFDHVRHDTSALKDCHELRMGAFVAHLRTISAESVAVPSEGTGASDRAVQEHMLDTYAEWALLAILRKMCLRWNPLIQTFTLVADDTSKDKSGKMIHDWPPLATWVALQRRVDQGHLLDVCRRIAIDFDKSTCPDVYLMTALVLTNMTQYMMVFLQKHAPDQAMPDDVKKVSSRIESVVDEMRVLDNGSSFAQKRMWLTIRLALPLGTYEAQDLMVGQNNPDRIGERKDWYTVRFTAVYEAARDVMSTMRYCISEEIKEDELKKLESATAKRIPKVPCFNDLMVEINQWLSHLPGKYTLQLPKCFGTSQAAQNLVPFMNEILNLALFAHKIDVENNLSVETSFLWNYIILEIDIDKKRDRWQTLTVQRDMKTFKRAPLIYIGSEGFAVLHGRKRTPFTSKALDACAAWYRICKQENEGLLDTGQELTNWCEPVADDEFDASASAQAGEEEEFG